MRQTEGEPEERRAGTCGAVSATCGPRGEENRFTYAHSWTDEEASGTTLQSWVCPLILHTRIDKHTGMYILSSMVAVFLPIEHRNT